MLPGFFNSKTPLILGNTGRQSVPIVLPRSCLMLGFVAIGAGSGGAGGFNGGAGVTRGGGGGGAPGAKSVGFIPASAFPGAVVMCLVGMGSFGGSAGAGSGTPPDPTRISTTSGVIHVNAGTGSGASAGTTAAGGATGGAGGNTFSALTIATAIAARNGGAGAAPGAGAGAVSPIYGAPCGGGGGSSISAANAGQSTGGVGSIDGIIEGFPIQFSGDFARQGIWLEQHMCGMPGGGSPAFAGSGGDGSFGCGGGGGAGDGAGGKGGDGRLYLWFL